MDYVRPLTEMLDLCMLLEPGFTDLENLACFNTCDDFVYLLGVCFCKDDIEGIKAFARSRLWFTYRRDFPAIGGTGPKSDKGWGCMLRCGQMLLAQALSVVHLGRNWQWSLNSLDTNYRRLLSMFQDTRTSLFSIHQIAQMGVSEGKPLGEWFGPNTIAQVLKKLVVYDEWSRLAVHVALDNILISDDVKIMAAHEDRKSSTSEPSHSNNSQGENGSRSRWKRPLLIIVPLRLGLTVINNCYLNAIKEFFKLPQCAGIIGGRPNHAVYFFGQAGTKMLYLDPHVCQGVANITDLRSSVANGHQHDHISHSNSPSLLVSGDNSQMVVINAPSPTTITPASVTPSYDRCELPMDCSKDCLYTSPIELSPCSTSTANKYDNGQPQFGNKISALPLDFELPNSVDQSISGPPSSMSSASNGFVDAANGPSSLVAEDGLELVASSSSASSLCSSGSSHSYASASSSSSSSTEILMSSSAHADERRYSMLSAIDGDEGVSNNCTAVAENEDQNDVPMDCSILNGGDMTIDMSMCDISSTSQQRLENIASEQPKSVVESLDAVYIGCSTTTETTTDNEGADDEALTDGSRIRQQHRHHRNPSSSHKSSNAFRCRSFLNESNGKPNVDSSETNIEDGKIGVNNDSDRRKRRVKRLKRNSTNSKADKPCLAKSEPITTEPLLETFSVKHEPRGSSNSSLSTTAFNTANTVTTTVTTSQTQTSSNDEKNQPPTVQPAEMKAEDNLDGPAEPRMGVKIENNEGDADSFDDSSFHCPYLLHMDFESLDPSLALAFICVCEEDYNDLVDRLNTSVINASSPPIFEILEHRPKGWPEFVPYALHDDSLKLKEYDDFGDPMFDSDDQFEILE